MAVNGDPVGSEAPRGKDCSKRMGRYDGSFTPSEQRLKNKLMKQFTRFGEGFGGNSAEYRDGWERTFGRKSFDGERLSSMLAEQNEWMREWTEDWFRSFNRDPYRDNYDAIDWSK
jgi:hypothetical protein